MKSKSKRRSQVSGKRLKKFKAKQVFSGSKIDQEAQNKPEKTGFRAAIKDKFHRIVDHSEDSPPKERVGFRDALKEKFHRVVDHESPSPSKEKHGFRDALHDKFHKISDKLHRPSTKTSDEADTSGYNNDRNIFSYENRPQSQHYDSSVANNRNPKVHHSLPGIHTGPYLIMKNIARKINNHAAQQPRSGQRHHHNYQQGVYNDYAYRPNYYADIAGSVCYNYLEYDGIVYGAFVCPIEGFDITATACCGPPREQYCCSPRDLAAYNADQQHQTRDSKRTSRFSTFLISFVIAMLVFFLCAYCIILHLCCKRLKTTKGDAEKPVEKPSEEKPAEEQELKTEDEKPEDAKDQD